MKTFNALSFQSECVPFPSSELKSFFVSIRESILMLFTDTKPIHTPKYILGRQPFFQPPAIFHL